MSDQDFNFTPPTKREPAKPFEPPPWERAQFEELERRKAAERAAVEEQAATAKAAQEASAAAAQTTAAAAAAVAPATRRESAAPAAGGEADSGSLDESHVDAMLVQLQGEEPRVGAGVWKVALAVSFVVGVIGLAISIFGLAVLGKKLGPTGALGGTVLVFFGIGFIGVGVYLAYQTLRQRGVL